MWKAYLEKIRIEHCGLIETQTHVRGIEYASTTKNSYTFFLFEYIRTSFVGNLFY